MNTRPRFAACLGLEPLEQRAMLSADPGWAFNIGGPATLSDSNVNIGPDHNIYVSGSFRGTVDFDPGAGVTQLTTTQNAQDGFVAKYTPQGALLWAKQFGQSIGHVGHEFNSGLEFDAVGNLYISGHSNSQAPSFGAFTLANQGNYDVFVAKLDASTGNFVWARNIGGANQETASGMTVSPLGDVYVTGSFLDTVDFNPGAGTFNMTAAGASDAFVLKLDSSGNFDWARQFGAATDEFGHRVALDNAGALYSVGTFRNTVDFGQPGSPLPVTSATPGVAAIYFSKLDESTGNTIWAQQIGGTGAVTAARVAVDGAGNLYVAGRFVDSVGFDLGATTLASNGGQDGFVARFDTAGNFVWADKIASGLGNVLPGTLRLDAAGNPLLAYSFDGTADFDPGPGVANLTSADSAEDGAVVKINADGSFGWVRQMVGSGVTEGSGVVEDSAGNVYVSGSFTNSVSVSTGHVLTNAGNGTFLTKLAFGDPATKFYVVDDSTSDRTFEYQASGVNGDNSALASGNSAPRGAASTAAGDHVWVVDANRTVYVYDINGNVLGSWSAGTMAASATPEGIATNGIDVWIVDSKSDKVFKYAGAASRLSGNQNAVSSFALTSSNADAKDIVTDGASLWVVNDTTTDKVFKYSVAGSLLGSWTIGSANSKPTGLTIDPTNVSDIWIVDSGTDLVYQYVSAASRISGSQVAASTYALAAGNTNPQGIADPPHTAMQQGPSKASGESLARAVPVSRSVGSDVTYFVRSADSAPVRKSAVALARQRVFETYTPQPNDVSALRTTYYTVAVSEPDLSGFHTCADDDQAAMDLAIESVFAGLS